MEIHYITTCIDSQIVDDKAVTINIFSGKKRIGYFKFLILPDQIYIDGYNIFNKRYLRKGIGTQAIEIIKGFARVYKKPILTDFESGSMPFYLKNAFKRASEGSTAMYWIPEGIEKNDYNVKII